MVALVPALLVTGVTNTAFAVPPDQWADNPPVSPLHVLLVLAAIPIGLFVLIVLLVYLPSMSKGESYRPGEVWRAEPTWFGGPREGTDGLDGDTAPVAVSAGSSTRGGTSGRW
jgi:hypothetical protein